MEKELAASVEHILRICSGLLDHTVWLLQQHGTEEEALKHRRAVAEVLTELGIKILYPIYDQYPDLEPPTATSTPSGGPEGLSCTPSPQGEDRPDLPQVAMSWDLLEVHLSSLELYADDAALRDILAPIGTGIQDACTRTTRILKEAPEEDKDSFLDDEAYQIENLLGTAFVVCQTRITAVVSAGIQLARYCAKNGIEFSAYPPRKEEILSIGPKLTGLQVTPVQFMDAVANYFKHQDEWHEVDWSKLTGLSKGTAQTIQKGGLQSGSLGNLRAGAAALGNTNFVSMGIFADIIDEWSAEVVKATKKALRR